MSLNAYQKVQNKGETPRQTEYRLFTEVTRALINARDHGKKDQVMFHALDWNRRMWSTLAADCGIEGNGLPDTLRAGIISLSIWVSKYSSQVVRNNEPIDPLIDINRTVMEGLATNVEAEKAALQNQSAPQSAKPEQAQAGGSAAQSALNTLRGGTSV